MKKALVVGSLAPALLIIPSLEAQTEQGYFTRAESFSHSAANPLNALLNVLIGPAPDNGDYALSRNSIEFGYRYERFELSLIHRNDYNLYFSPESAEFAYLNQNAQQIPPDRRYEVDVEANQYQLTGVKGGYHWPLSDTFALYGNLALYHATEAVYGHLGKDENGEGGYIGISQVTVNGQPQRILDGELHADYYYTDDPLFQRAVNAPSGKGYSVDIGFRWQVLPNLTVEAEFADLLGEIRWSDLPHTIADATSETITFDEDGLLEAHPYFDGQERFDDLDQELTHRERINLEYRYHKYSFGYEYDRMRVVTFHRLIAGYHWDERWGISGSYDTTSRAYGMRLHMPIGEAFVTLDELDSENAHTFGFGWSLTYQF